MEILPQMLNMAILHALPLKLSSSPLETLSTSLQAERYGLQLCRFSHCGGHDSSDPDAGRRVGEPAQGHLQHLGRGRVGGRLDSPRDMRPVPSRNHRRHRE